MIYTITTIAPVCAKLHAQGKKIVLATGFFDLLHQEHINFLTKAKVVGDILIVAVESDERARALKGEGRPVKSQLVRCQKVSLIPLRSKQRLMELSSQALLRHGALCPCGRLLQ